MYTYIKGRYGRNTRENPPHTEFSFQTVSSWLCIPAAFPSGCSLLVVAPLAGLLWLGVFGVSTGGVGHVAISGSALQLLRGTAFLGAPSAFPDSHSLSQMSLRAGSHPCECQASIQHSCVFIEAKHRQEVAGWA